jgi:hypothetical protein
MKTDVVMPIQTESASQLSELRMKKGWGRFSKMNRNLRKSIMAAKPGEIRLVPPSRTMVINQKERLAFLSAANMFLDRFTPKWRGAWSNEKQIFYFARKRRKDAKA